MYDLLFPYFFSTIFSIILFTVYFLLYKYKVKVLGFKLNKKKGWILTFSFLSFSFLGLSIGLLSGWSSTPVIGSVLPAVLSFYGGIISLNFIFHKNSNFFNNILLLIILLVLSISLIIGVFIGVNYRLEQEKINESYRQKIMNIEQQNKNKQYKKIDLTTKNDYNN